MKTANSSSWLLSAVVLALSMAAPANAQITPDATLPNNSVVLPNGNLLTIEGGTIAGTNLFHSFQEFSIPTGSEAFFNNASSLENIITRVTGGNLSDIDGLIRANGGANLFLLNPNGIQFGPNASLEIGGSFLGSSADRLLFEDGSFYSASQTNTAPLLSIDVPIGLQLGGNPGTIQVTGPGNQTFVNPVTGEIDISLRPLGLSLFTGQSLTLVGGDIFIPGGNMTAFPGTIELASVGANEIVDLSVNESGFTLNYDRVESFGDIELSQAAGVLAAGGSQSELRIQARNLTLTEASALSISANTPSSISGGDITIRTSESVNVFGATPFLATSIGATLGSGSLGDGGSINLETGTLRLAGGALINATTASQGNAGNVSIRADRIEISGLNPNSPFPTAIASVSLPFATGDAGNINIQTGRLLVRDGAAISSATFSPGSAGDVTIDAQSIELRDFAQQGTLSNTGIFSSVSETDVGDGGNITINTGDLRIADGLQISASSAGRGKAGNINISANTIELTGTSPVPVPGAVFQGVQPSSIVAAGFGVGSNAGSITIAAEEVRLKDGAAIAVSSLIFGDAGNLQIDAPVLRLDNGQLQSNASSGSQGNIIINSSDLRLRNNSSITTNATGEASGGNISLNTDTLVAIPRENSDISANAEQSFGGRVNITVEGIFGTQFRDAPTRESDITATSALGAEFSGIVQIQTPDVDAASGLVALDGDTLDPDTQVSDSCEIATRSRFAITGNGGLPEDPTQSLQVQTVWRDTRLGEIQSTLTPNPAEVESQISSTPTLPLVEATGWRTNSRGQIELIVASGNPSHSPWQPHPECNEVSQESVRRES